MSLCPHSLGYLVSVIMVKGVIGPMVHALNSWQTELSKHCVVGVICHEHFALLLHVCASNSRHLRPAAPTCLYA